MHRLKAKGGWAWLGEATLKSQHVCKKFEEALDMRLMHQQLYGFHSTEVNSPQMGRPTAQQILLK
jgi:hypothetical protein